MFKAFSEILDYRSMIKNLVKRDIRGRYKGSILGFLWNFIMPMVQIVVYILVFTKVFKPSIDNYAIYLTIGMVVWIWFSDSLVEASGTMVLNSDMLKKIYFPRSTLPISVILSRAVTYILTLMVLFVILFATGYGISWSVLFLPVAMVILMAFMLGMALALSALDAYFRDVQYIVTALMMAWIWLTPIMYVADSIESDLMTFILSINPMTYMMKMFQDIFYWQCIPTLETVLICIGLALVSLVVGVLVFRVLEKDFAEVL